MQQLPVQLQPWAQSGSPQWLLASLQMSAQSTRYGTPPHAALGVGRIPVLCIQQDPLHIGRISATCQDTSFTDASCEHKWKIPPEED